MKTTKSTLTLVLCAFLMLTSTACSKSNEEKKIESLKVALKAAESIHNADTEKMDAWQQKFIAPFRRKLEKKLKKRK